MSAEPRRLRQDVAASVCKSAFMTATLAAALGCIMAMARPAAADPQASNLSGRWSQAVAGSKPSCTGAGCRLTYDLVRCGDGWCGIEVKDGKDCGRTAMRLDAGAAHAQGVEFSGRYEKVQGTEPYTVSATLSLSSQPNLPEPQLRLSVRGSTGGALEPFRRVFPLHMVLMREGEPACRADPRLS